MGSWNAKPFGNDTALDWLAGLEDSREITYLANTINNVMQATGPLDASKSEEALAAAAVVAAAAVDPIRRVPEAARAWVLEHGFVPSRSLVSAALTLVQRIVADSELRLLWQESGSITQWLRETNAVIEQLRKAAQAAPPKREAKPRGLPRLLYKMVEVHAAACDERLGKQIRNRLLSLQDVNEPSKDTHYEPPLCMPARTPFVEEARLLIERGADVNTKLGHNTPLVTACSAGQTEMARVLLDAGAKLFEEIMIDAKSRLPMETVLDKKKARPVGFHYAPGLYAAARTGNPATIDLLLSHGADRLQTDLNGETLLHLAAEAGNAATLRHLIMLGLDVNQTKPDSSDSPLHYAVRAGRIDAARVLLENRAEPNLVAGYGEGTALDIAEGGSAPIFQLLRGFGGLLSREIRDRRQQE
jgi:ankyrin repeat protein